MKKYVLVLLLFITAASLKLSAQTDAINIKTAGLMIDFSNTVGGGALHGSAIMQVEAYLGAGTTNPKGFLMPRVALATDINTACSCTPATGLLAYQTGGTAGIYYYDGTAWRLLVNSAGAVFSFNAGSTGFTPNTATTGAVTLAGILNTANGGMGANISPAAIGAIPYASSTTAYTTLPAAAIGAVLVSQGTGTAPSWSLSSGTGAQGYWTRTGTTLSTTNAGDNVTITGLSTLSALTQAGTASINASGAATTAIGSSSAGAITAASGAASSFTVTGNNLTLATATSGSLNLTSAGVSTYTVPANTALSQRTSNGTVNYEAIDTRTTTSGISAFTYTAAAPTIASATGASFVTSTITPPLLTFSGTTGITSLLTPGLLINQPTVSDASALTINDASAFTINGGVKTGGSAAITRSSALRIPAVAVNGGGTIASSYGIYVDAQTGATNNYAAAFNTGNVGIGTNAPLQVLEIGGTGGTARLNGVKSGGSYNVVAPLSSYVLYATSAGDVSSLPAVNNATLTTNGSGQPAWVSTSTTVTANAWSLTGNTGTTPSAAAIGIAVTAGSNFIGTTDNKDLVIATNDGTSTLERMRVRSTGNVGIATNAPVTRFQLNSKVSDDNAYAYDANSAYFIHPTPTATATLNDPKTILMLARQGTGGQAYGAAAAFNLSRYENSGVNSRTRLDITLANASFDATSNNIMTLFSSGNVGIGTTSPGSIINSAAYFKPEASGRILDLYSSANESVINLISNQNTSGAHLGGLYFTRSAGQGDAHLQVAAIQGRQSGTGTLAGGELWFFTKGSGGGNTVDDARMIINSNGFVGIGVVPGSTFKLDVQGGKLRTAGIDESSDIRLKKNISPIHEALQKVMAMNGVTYNWRKDEFPAMNFEAELQFGLIAQELEKIIPELVTTDDKGWKSIEYSHLVPVLIEAIKELSEKNEQQQGMINTQQKENLELRTSLENIVTRMTILENTIGENVNKAGK